MGVGYRVSRFNFTPVAGQDLLTIVPASGKRVCLVELLIGSNGSSSASQVIQVSRTTGGANPGGSLTPDKVGSSDSPASSASVYTSWGTQPTMPSHPALFVFSAPSGSYVYRPCSGRGEEANDNNGEKISIRFPSGGPTPQAMSLTAIFADVF